MRNAYIFQLSSIYKISFPIALPYLPVYTMPSRCYLGHVPHKQILHGKGNRKAVTDMRSVVWTVGVTKMWPVGAADGGE